MKKSSLLLPILALVAAPVLAADPADDVKSAAKKLTDKSYSWTTKTESARANTGNDAAGGNRGNRGGGRGFGGGDVSGKTDKDGFVVLSMARGENTTEVVIKGDKYAMKQGDEWKTGEELSADNGDGTPGRGRFMGMIVQRTKVPATDAQDLVGKTKELKKDGDSYTGELTAEAVKAANSFAGGRRPGGNDNAAAATGPDTSGIKGTVTFWVKDGTLAKYQTKYTGMMTARGRDGGDSREIPVDRTTTVEIKDVGTAKVEVPAEAKKKLKG